MKIGSWEFTGRPDSYPACFGCSAVTQVDLSEKAAGSASSTVVPVAMHFGQVSDCRVRCFGLEFSENLNCFFLIARETSYFEVAIAGVYYPIVCTSLYLKMFVSCANAEFVVVETMGPRHPEPLLTIRTTLSDRHFAPWSPKAN